MASNKAPFGENYGAQSEMVPISGCSLYLKGSGPVRTSPDQPVVIIEAGWESCSSEWVPVQRLVSEFARVYSYDRAGYGRSDPPLVSKGPLTAQNRAKDLKALLVAAGVAPPYIIVGHSYGGTIARAFLLENAQDIQGMVLVDAPVSLIPPPGDRGELLGGADLRTVIGLAATQAMSKEEYDAVVTDSKAGKGTAAAEWEHLEASFEAVAHATRGKQLLGDHRLSVILNGREPDLRKLLVWAEEHKNGSEELRKAWRKCLDVDGWGRQENEALATQLDLSRNARKVVLEGEAATHNVQMVKPEVIVNEIKWVLGLPS